MRAGIGSEEAGGGLGPRRTGREGVGRECWRWWRADLSSLEDEEEEEYADED